MVKLRGMNKNMRCMETCIPASPSDFDCKMNKNMRCMETFEVPRIPAGHLLDEQEHEMYGN